jgi:hypothetical protein
MGPRNESQMAEEKKVEKKFLAFGRISIGRKWSKPAQVDLHLHAPVSVHLLWIRPISPCNRWAKKVLQDSGQFFYEKSRSFWWI